MHDCKWPILKKIPVIVLFAVLIGIVLFDINSLNFLYNVL